MRKFILLLLTSLCFLTTIVSCGPEHSTPKELVEVKYTELVDVKGGQFRQEDISGNGFDHTISDFKMGKYEVTYELWYKVYTWAKENGYTFQNPGKEGRYANEGAEPSTNEKKYEPVTCISWRDAIVWCNAYSELCGYTPVYKHKKKVVKSSCDKSEESNLCEPCDTAIMDPKANGYRLPTEGQWQYAASYIDGEKFASADYASGTNKSYKDEEACKEVAWFSENSGDNTHPVGKLKANALGIHDMSGNVWKWCWDWRDDYPSEPQTDYTGEPRMDVGDKKPNRGGGWYDGSTQLRVGYRYGQTVVSADILLGLRVVRVEH